MKLACSHLHPLPHVQLKKVTGIGDQMLKKLRSFEQQADVHGLTMPEHCDDVNRVSQLQQVIAQNQGDQEITLYTKALGISQVCRAATCCAPPSCPQ